ncbi:TMEM175 family protein [Jatrophihabitans sp. YIM 134969]
MAEDGARNGPERLVTLVDAVVAIAMTLLALDLRPDLPKDVSSRGIAAYFGDHYGEYLAFVLAFAIIAQYWVVHHRMMRDVVRHDDALTWATMLFLFGVTLLPLTSFVTGNYGAPLATTIFAGSLVLLSISLTVLSEVIHRRGLRDAPLDPDVRARGVAREVVTIGVPLLVAVLTWFVPHASYLFLLLFLSDVPGRIALRLRDRRRVA